MRFSGGVRVFSANKSGSPVITLASSGVIVSAAGTLGSNGNGTKTVSTASPSGGSDGDIWYQVIS
jgi:hypothetical protein